MRSILLAVLTVCLHTQGGEQTQCPSGKPFCNCQLNNVEPLRALVRSEIETQVEQEVERRMANTSGKAWNDVQYTTPLAKRV